MLLPQLSHFKPNPVGSYYYYTENSNINFFFQLFNTFFNVQVKLYKLNSKYIYIFFFKFIQSLLF